MDLINIKNWQTAHRPESLACGAPIPSIEEVVKRWGKLADDDPRRKALENITKVP